MEKINSYIPTPLILNCFCVKCYSVPDNEKPHIYRLYSVITHVGATMSVGHYIAYTCSLDVFKAYVNCPKDKNKKELLNSRNQTKSDTQSSSSSAGSGSEKNSGRMKKIIFGRSKASSSGDMTKNFKNNINGVMNKIVNGSSDKIIPTTSNIVTTTTTTAPPTPCPGLNCCGIQAESIVLRNSTTNIFNGEMTSTSNDIDMGNVDKNVDKLDPYNRYDGRINATRNGSGESSSRKYGGSGGGDTSNGSRFEPTWYMCDDDKIKAMSQDEFENLLSPNNKVTITPYLLFYARVNNEK